MAQGQINDLTSAARFDAFNLAARRQSTPSADWQGLADAGRPAAWLQPVHWPEKFDPTQPMVMARTTPMQAITSTAAQPSIPSMKPGPRLLASFR